MRASFIMIAAAAGLLLDAALARITVSQVAVPEGFRAPEPLPEVQAASFADLKWLDVFRDPPLQRLIRTALALS